MQAGEIRNGNTFDIDGNVYQVLEFQHVKPGKEAEERHHRRRRRENFPPD